MGQPRIRVYYGPEDQTSQLADQAIPKVSIPLNELSALLAHAVNGRKAWLDDFADDQVTISEDLYEVLMAYDRIHRRF